MIDGKYNIKLDIIIAIGILFVLVLAGCTNNTDDTNDNKDEETNITAEQFIGTWVGQELQNQIPLNITFNENNTGLFQEIKITWEFNETTLVLGMYEGESPSYYLYEFSNSDQSLELQNRFSNETFVLEKT